jgi:hypothetical protein
MLCIFLFVIDFEILFFAKDVFAGWVCNSINVCRALNSVVVEGILNSYSIIRLNSYNSN